MIMMKCQSLDPEETTDLRHVTEKLSHMCSVPEANSGCSGVRPGDLRRQESNSLAH